MIGDWRGRAFHQDDGGLDYCSVAKVMRNGAVLLIGLSARNEMEVVLVGADFRLPLDVTGRVELSVDGDVVGTASGRVENADILRAPLGQNDEAFERLRTGEELTIRGIADSDFNPPAISFLASLNGAEAALTALRRCAGVDEVLIADSERQDEPKLGPTFVSGQWQGRAYYAANGGVAYCTIAREKQNRDALLFRLFVGNGLTLEISSADRTRRLGDPVRIQVEVDDQPIGAFDSVVSLASVLEVPIGDDEESFRLLRFGEELRVQTAGDDLRFDLDGAADALLALRRCVGSPPSSIARSPSGSPPPFVVGRWSSRLYEDSQGRVDGCAVTTVVAGSDSLVLSLASENELEMGVSLSAWEPPYGTIGPVQVRIDGQDIGEASATVRADRMLRVPLGDNADALERLREGDQLAITVEERVVRQGEEPTVTVFERGFEFDLDGADAALNAARGCLRAEG